MTTFERVKNVLVKEFGLNPHHVTPQFSIGNQMDADSLARVEISLCIEEEFGIGVPEGIARQIDTVQDIVEYIVYKQATEGDPNS